MKKTKITKLTLHELCSKCKKLPRHDKTIILNLNDGSWVHKECE